MLDAWCRRHTGRDFDSGGQWARSGSADPALLALLLAEPYLQRPPPKSTGRELFNLSWLDERLGAHLGASPVFDHAVPSLQLAAADVQATLLDYTVESLARPIAQYAPRADIYVCGGGAHDLYLLERLQQRLPGQRVQTTAALGLDPDYVEAVAFAWFAQRTLAGQP